MLKIHCRSRAARGKIKTRFKSDEQDNEIPVERTPWRWSERTNDDRNVFSLEDSGGFPPEEEKSEFQLKTEENCKLQTAQGMLHCYMKPGGRSWLEKVPVAEETTKKQRCGCYCFATED